MEFTYPIESTDLPLDAFVARSQEVARWLDDARAVFLGANVGRLSDEEFHDAILWLAATGVVPVVPTPTPAPDDDGAPRDKKPPEKYVPNFAPERIVVSADAQFPRDTRSIAGYAGRDETEVHPVVCWIAPVVHAERKTPRFMTPIAALHREVADAEQRYRAAEEQAARRLNVPLMFGRDPTGGTPSDAGKTPADALTPPRRAATYVPYYPGPAPAVVHRLYHGATYRDVRDNLRRPFETLPPFDAEHAAGIAAALTKMCALLGVKKTIRPNLHALRDAPEPAPAAKRPRRDPDDPDSDTDNES